MRQYADWEEVDLLALIRNQVPEQTRIEYKKCGALRDQPQRARDEVVAEISRHVSAMANADGGVIVYGMVERHQVATRLDAGFDPALDRNSEWLETAILTSISPKIEGLIVKPIPLSGTREGRFAYIVAMERSLRGHQANDGRYYRRRNLSIDRLEDFEIRELMNRATRSTLVLDLGFEYLGRQANGVREFELHASLNNAGPLRVRDLRVELLFPTDFVIALPEPRRMGVIVDSRTTVPGFEVCRVVFTPGCVLFPEQSVKFLGDASVGQLRYRVTSELDEVARSSDIAVISTVYADDNPPLRGRKLMRELYPPPPPRYVVG